MIKRMMICCLVTLLLMNHCGIGGSKVWGTSKSGILITVNGVQVVSDTAPFIEYGRTYVPVRAVLEAFGVDSIDWQSPDVIVKDGDTTLKIPVLGSHIERNGDWISTDAPALIRNGRTCLPIRAVIEALGGRVAWEPVSRTVVIVSGTPVGTQESNMRIISSGIQGVELAEYSPSGNLVSVSFGENQVAVWNSTDGVLRHLGGPEATGIKRARFTSDGRTISTIDERGAIKHWDGFTGSQISQVLLKYPEEMYPVADISDDGNTVITSISAEEVAVYNAKTRELIARHQLKDNYMDSVQFSKDAGKFMMMSDYRCSVWNTGTGALESAFGSEVLEARFSPNGRKVFTIAQGNFATIWDSASGQKDVEVILEGGYVSGVEFSPDGRCVAIAKGKTIYLLDARTLKVTAEFSGHASDVRMVRFASEGERLVSASSDGTARVWNADTGKPMALLTGHTGIVESAVFSPDGKMVLTTSSDRSVRIWSLDYYIKLLEAPVQKIPQTESGGISIVSDVGSFKDGGFNELALQGLKQAESRYGIRSSSMESANEVDYSLNLDTASKQNSSLICAVGFMMADALKDVAASYPEKRYVILDTTYGEETPSNITGVTFKMNEVSFLMGYIAGKMTKTNKLSFVGGVDFSLIREYEYGYRAGVRLANPSCQVISEYAGSFSDAAAGKEIAEKMYDQGVDIIYHASGITGYGIIEAAKEKGKYVIGAETDQSKFAPDNILTSAVKQMDIAMLNVAKAFNEGSITGGETLEYGLAEGGVGIAPTTGKHVPVIILKELESIQKQIIDGTILVPKTQEEYEVLIKNVHN